MKHSELEKGTSNIGGNYLFPHRRDKNEYTLCKHHITRCKDNTSNTGMANQMLGFVLSY